MPSSTTKVTKPLRFVVFLSSRLIGILRFRLTQINPSSSRSQKFFLMYLNFRHRWMNNRRGCSKYKLRRINNRRRSTLNKPQSYLIRNRFLNINISSSLEVEVLSIYSLAIDNSSSKLLIFFKQSHVLSLNRIQEFIAIKQF